MTRTRFLRLAYNGSMETLLLVFLLALSEKDEQFKQRLKQVLEFYRENRELLIALTGSRPNAGEAETKKGAETPAEEEKSSPPSEGESLRILDEFLKKI